MKDFNVLTGRKPSKPKLLMLSHCVPAAQAKGEQNHRAWQLLQTYGRSHEIHLACLADGPVSLAQWRSLHARTRQIVIEPARRVRQLLGGIVRLLAPAAGETITMGGHFRQPVREWQAKVEFQAVLCTRLALIEAVQPMTQCHRLVDLHQQSAVGDPRLAHCDWLIVSDGEQARRHPEHAKRIILVPTVDAARNEQPIRLTPSEELHSMALPMPLKKAA